MAGALLNIDGKFIIIKHAYMNRMVIDAVARLLGEDRPMRFTQADKKGFFSKLFGS